MKRFLLITALLLVGYLPAQALDRSDIRDAIRIRIKDTDSTRQRYTDAQLNDLINQEQRDVINVSWMLKDNTSIVLSTGTTYYNIPATVMEIERVTLDFKNLPETSLQELDSEFSGGDWALTDGKPTRYFQDPSQSGVIGVYPFPQQLLSTGTLRMNFFAMADDMDDDADIPFNGESRYTPHHDLLVYGPCYKIFVIEGDSGRALEYRQYYESRLGLLMEKVGLRVNFLPGFSGQRK